MTRAEIKNFAKERLGRNIFGNLWLTALLICFIATALESFAGAIGLGLGAFVLVGPLEFGMSYAFLKLARDGETPNVEDLFKGFTQDFAQNFLIGLLIGIFTFLWSLLLIVPGIVKAYAYSRAYYIKADHPDYDWRACIKGSMELMRGHKWELFVLDLSFLGWYIVGSLCLGIGTFWVVPYHLESRAVFYNQLCGRTGYEGIPAYAQGYDAEL